MDRSKYVAMPFILLVIAFLSVPPRCDGIRCRSSPGGMYFGVVLDCSHTGLSSDDIRTLDFPYNITTLILSDNGIGTLQNNSLSQFTRLKRLECLWCELTVLEVLSLDGLNELHDLILSYNHLKITNHAFPFGCFRHVPELKTLHLDNNDNQGYISNYSKFLDIFDSLPELQNLKIDSFSNLTIGKEFAKLKNLNSLEVTCRNLENINNESLNGFENSTVKHFALLNGSALYDREECENLFQYLPNVSSLAVVRMSFGNMKVMMMMNQLQGKHINLLHLDDVSIYYSIIRSEERRIHDSMISFEMLKYLKHVCIAHFVWLHSYAASIDIRSVTYNEWVHCLRSMKIVVGKKKDVIVNRGFELHFLNLKNMESLIYMLDIEEEAIDFWRQHVHIGSIARDNNLVFEEPTFDSEKRSSITNKEIMKIEVVDGTFKSMPHETATLPSVTFVVLPQFLTKVVLNNIAFCFLNSNFTMTKNRLRTVILRNSENGCILNNRIFGMTNLETFDFTGSKLTGDPSFFKWFPALRKLVLRGTQQTSEYLSQVAENVHGLEYFDIADNGLKWLPSDMFHSNIKLKYLCLSFNNFGMIPFHIDLTPNLEILDLRQNSVTLSRRTDLQSIDDHLRQTKNFTLLLGDNQISCACSALHFLRWLRDSNVNFDKGGNYTCMTEAGTISHTASFSDLESFWRQCQGTSYFLVSLILLSTLTALYMAMFIGMKHKTLIVSKVMQLVVPDFRLKTKKDFNYDVVVGYADQDGNFVRNVLLRYLEDMWGLQTFVHQRDLLHDPLLMSQAIRDGWRTLLIVTENFLDRYDMAHNVMKVCTFFVHSTNPRSVVVMVEERVRHRIPDYVLQVVDDDNIIVIPALDGFDFPLDCETKETLRTRIL